MGILSAGVGALIGGFGEKPDIPILEEIRPTDVQRQTTRGNIQNLAGLQNLGQQANQFMLQQRGQTLDFAVPGGLEQAQQTVGSQLRGEIPTDVGQQVARQSAAQGFALGTQGSQFSRNLTARDLGLTSLQIQQRGMQNFGSLAQLASVPEFNPAQMFFTPQQRLNFAFQERQAQFQRNLLAAGIDAAPDPTKAAITQGIADSEAAIGQILGSVAGVAATGVGACWIAREVYGQDNPKWRVFRIWLFLDAPAWFREWYLQNGAQFAKWLRSKPVLQRFLRGWMDRIVRLTIKRYG